MTPEDETVPLHVEASGQGEPLIVLHGLYGSGTNWKSHARWLAEDHRVLLADLRNHGRSPHAPDMGYRVMAADVVRLLDEQAVDGATVIGHSMGGKVAMTLALLHPERVRSLVVVDIAPVAYEPRHEALIESLRALDLEAVGSRRDADRLLARDVGDAGVRQFLLTNLERRDDGYGWRIPLGILADQLPVVSDFPDLPGRWPGPALFVHGGRSDYVTEGSLDTISRYFPNAEVAVIPEAGHWVHAEAPEAFAEAVRGFLSRYASP